MDIEELQNKVLELNDEINTLTDDKEALLNQVKELQSKIQKLQQTNQELFIRCTNPKAEEPEVKTKSIEELSKLLRRN